MNTAMKTLSALAIVTAALAATAMPSNALPNGPAGTYLGGGHGPVQPPKLTLPPSASKLGSLYGHGITCFACTLPHPNPPVGPKPVNGHGDDWGHGWNQWYGWNREYGERGRPEIIVEGQPAAMVVSAPAQSAPAYAPARSAAAYAAPASQAAAEPCNCLTKQSLPDGSVLFQDICTKESAIATPATLGAR
jgi:hypothetical protein